MLTFFVVLASGLYIRSARAAGGALDFLEVHDPVGVVQCGMSTSAVLVIWCLFHFIG
jgi:hypothetical protein